MLYVFLQMTLKNNHQKFNENFPCIIKHFNIVLSIFLLLFLTSFVYSFISPRFDLNLIWSFFASAGIISPSFILLIRLKAISSSLNFALVVGPLYLYIKLSALTFLSYSVISSSLSSASLWNIYFCFKISGLSSSS